MWQWQFLLSSYAVSITCSSHVHNFGTADCPSNFGSSIQGDLVGFPSLALKAYGLQALRAEKENDTSIHMSTLVYTSIISVCRAARFRACISPSCLDSHCGMVTIHHIHPYSMDDATHGTLNDSSIDSQWWRV